MWFLLYLFAAYAMVVLRLVGTIEAPWGWVLAPLWVPILAGVIVGLMFKFLRERN